MAKNNSFKDKMHPRDKKTLIIIGITSAVVVCVGLGLSAYLRFAPTPLPVAVAPQSTSSSTSVDMSKYEIKKDTSTSTKSASETDKTVQTTDENGNTTIEKEIGKPNAPSASPELADGTDLTNPDVKPEYKPQPTTPKMGDTRVENGVTQTFIDGFGWLDGTGSGGEGEIADFELSGEKVGK